MKYLIIDTGKWSDGFAINMATFITDDISYGTSINTPSVGNNGYGFCAKLDDDGYEAGKQHYIEYKRNELKKNVLDVMEFYKDTRADISYYLSEKKRREDEIQSLEARDKSTFLPYETSQSVLIDITNEYEKDSNILTKYEARAIQYCKENDIPFYGFRYELPKKSKEVTKIQTTDRTDIKVRICEFMGHIVIETINPDDIDDYDFHNATGSYIGCSLNNPKRLGISPEALEIIKTTKRGRDAIGDLCGDSNYFSWIGGANMILGPKLVGSRDYKLCDGFVTIENSISESIKEKVIDSITIKEIDYKDVKFDTWLTFDLQGGDYLISLNTHEKHFNLNKVKIINVPDGLSRADDDYVKIKLDNESIHDIHTLVYHNIFGVKSKEFKKPRVYHEDEVLDEFDEIIKKFEEFGNIFDRCYNPGYFFKLDPVLIWDYVNSFFDLGFTNNIMYPSKNYFRLSFNGTVDELKEKLSNFKLVK